METTNEIIKYEQRQRIIEKMGRVTSAVSDFSARVAYDNKAYEMIKELYCMSLGYLCDAIIELDDIDEEKRKTVKRKVK